MGATSRAGPVDPQGSSPVSVDDIAALTGIRQEALRHLAARVEQEYRQESRAVRGKRRTLSIPSPLLKKVQRLIYRQVLLRLPISKWAFAGAGRGAVSNARVHLGHTHVMIEDIENCFPNVRPQVVRQALLAYGLDSESAGLLMRLCTAFGALPQGAPTSARILDLVLSPIDDRLSLLAEREGLTYSRYVDDITISGDKATDLLRDHVARALRTVGLTLRRDKSRSFREGMAATVTGIVLAGNLRPTPAFLQHLSRELRHAANGTSNLSLDQLRGRVAWVKQLNPSMGRSFGHYLARAARRRANVPKHREPGKRAKRVPRTHD